MTSDTILMNVDSPYLDNQFLIAMPGLADSYFARTVTYLCQHNGDGALGIMINRPSALTIGDVMRQLDIAVLDASLEHTPVYIGGPVQPDRGFILHTASTPWGSTLRVSDTVSLTTSRDILEAIASGRGPGKVLFALGYAGWSQGQLEDEMKDNAWLSVPADDAVVFDVSAAERWRRSADLLGINISLLTAQAGHG
ncbi:MAG: hypothetical protein RIQ52_2098 [Pseudomonadota bacterium]